ncbi:hypothetical protein BHE74_00011323, partial [Ensete ventricosum]
VLKGNEGKEGAIEEELKKREEKAEREEDEGEGESEEEEEEEAMNDGGGVRQRGGKR